MTDSRKELQIKGKIILAMKTKAEGAPELIDVVGNVSGEIESEKEGCLNIKKK